VNSIENFARSWTRAAAFHEVTPHRPSFVFADHDQHSDDEEAIQYGRSETSYGGPRTSLLRAHLEASASPEDAIAIDDESNAGDEGPTGKHKESMSQRHGIASVQGSMRGRGESIFAIAPHLATPLAGSYGTSYGTLHSSITESSMAHAGHLWREQQAQAHASKDERPPMILKEIEQDGKKIFVVEGQSTLPQTIFNSTNVLIGVGLLSLPMGFKYSGWICGMIFLALSAAVTAYTARLLAKCMDTDPQMITFADIAYCSFGQKARIATSLLFTVELLAACVALVVLFADTLNLLIPGVGVNEWKVICGLFLIPLQFVPLRLLSFSSVIGILSCFSSKSMFFFIKATSRQQQDSWGYGRPRHIRNLHLNHHYSNHCNSRTYYIY
jgi:vesicular inhibitory amino acid transporter